MPCAAAWWAGASWSAARPLRRRRLFAAGAGQTGFRLPRRFSLGKFSEQALRCGGHFFDRIFEHRLVRLRWLVEAAHLANELARGRGNLIARGWLRRTAKYFDTAAHGSILSQLPRRQQARSLQKRIGVRIAAHETAVELRRILAVALRQHVPSKARSDVAAKDPAF